MALWHSFKLQRMFIDDEEFRFVKDSVILSYYPQNQELMVRIKYFLNEKVDRFFGLWRSYPKKKLKLDCPLDEYAVKLHVVGDEKTGQIKNIGMGVAVGAAIAGPIGAGIGAYIGNNHKSVPCIIEVPEAGLVLHAFATAGYLKDCTEREFYKTTKR